MIGDPVPFFCDACLADVGSKTTNQELAEQWMESIFLASMTITRDGKKHVLLRQLRQCRRAAQLWKQRATEIERERFEQGKIHQQPLRLSRLTRKNLLGDLTHKLKRSYPSLRSPAILGYLFVFQLDVERLFEQLFYFVVCEKKIVARYHQRSRLRLSPHSREWRKIAGRYDQMDQVRRVLQESIDQLVNDRIASDMVIVIQDKNEWLLDRFKYLVDQEVGRALRKAKHLFVRFAQVWKDCFAECRIQILDAVRDIAEKHDRIRVSMVELVPNGRPCLAANKIGDQSGLAAPSVRRNHCYRRTEVSLQLFR